MNMFRSFVKRPMLDNTLFIVSVMPFSSSLSAILAALISLRHSGNKRLALSNESTIGIMTTECFFKIETTSQSLSLPVSFVKYNATVGFIPKEHSSKASEYTI